MRGVWALSRFLLTMLRRERSGYLIVVAALFMIAAALAFGGTNIGMRYKLFEDTLLSTQGILLQMAALFYTFLLLSRERALELYVLPLAYGMGRSAYLLGLMISLVWMLALVTGALMAADMALMWIVEGGVCGVLLWQLFLYYLAALMSTALMVALSHYVSITNALIYTIILSFAGNALDELVLYAADHGGEMVNLVVQSAYYLLPNYSVFDHQSSVVNRGGWEVGSFVLIPVGYAAVWWGIAYTLAWLRFVTKALRGSR